MGLRPFLFARSLGVRRALEMKRNPTCSLLKLTRMVRRRFTSSLNSNSFRESRVRMNRSSFSVKKNPSVRWGHMLRSGRAIPNSSPLHNVVQKRTFKLSSFVPPGPTLKSLRKWDRWEWIFSLASLLQFLGFLMPELLTLRLLSASSALSFVVAHWGRGFFVGWFWCVLYLSANVGMIAWLLYRSHRPIEAELSKNPELWSIYTRFFERFGISMQEFSEFMGYSHRRVITEPRQAIIKQGESLTKLYLLLDGQVMVVDHEDQDSVLATITGDGDSGMNWIGEMSYLSREEKKTAAKEIGFEQSSKNNNHGSSDDGNIHNHKPEHHHSPPSVAGASESVLTHSDTSEDNPVVILEWDTERLTSYLESLGGLTSAKFHRVLAASVNDKIMNSNEHMAFVKHTDLIDLLQMMNLGKGKESEKIAILSRHCRVNDISKDELKAVLKDHSHIVQLPGFCAISDLDLQD